MQTLLIDSHCHLDMLDLAPFGGTMDAVLANAEQQGVGGFLSISVDMETFPTVLAIARRYPTVHASVGVHPNYRDGHEPSVDELVALAADPRVVAIGETGLDYFRSEGDLTWQRERFGRHIAAARVAGKPLVVHCREARADTLRIMEEEGAAQTGGVMHCFVEDWDSAARAMDMGFYISFSGIVTFKSATDLKQVAARVPADRLLLETDSPFLAPVPHRGQVNQPAFVRHVAEHVAELRGVSLETLAAQTSANYRRLFRL